MNYWKIAGGVVTAAVVVGAFALTIQRIRNRNKMVQATAEEKDKLYTEMAEFIRAKVKTESADIIMELKRDLEAMCTVIEELKQKG